MTYVFLQQQVKNYTETHYKVKTEPLDLAETIKWGITDMLRASSQNKPIRGDDFGSYLLFTLAIANDYNTIVKPQYKAEKNNEDKVLEDIDDLVSLLQENTNTEEIEEKLNLLSGSLELYAKEKGYVILDELWKTFHGNVMNSKHSK